MALTDYEHQRMAEDGTHRPETLPDIIMTEYTLAECEHSTQFERVFRTTLYVCDCQIEIEKKSAIQTTK